MTVTDRSASRWICAAAVAGLILRATFGMVYWVGKPLTHDEREYLALAQSLTAGRGLTYEPPPEAATTQQFGRAPGYPVFLALIGAGRSHHDHSPTGVKLAQALVGAVAVWLIGLIGLRAAGTRAGVAAAGLAALYPPLVWITSYVFSEALYSLLALAAAFVLQHAVDRGEGEGGSTRFGAAAGVVAGLAMLVRPAMIFFVPLALIWLVGRRQLNVGVAFGLAAILVVAPWTVRNVHAYGRFVLIASEGGVTFWTGNHPLARGEGDLAANPEMKVAELEFRKAHPGLTPEQLEPFYYGDAFRHILEQPGRWLTLMLRKVFYTIVPIGPSYTLHSTRYWAASVLSYLILLPLAIAGIWRLWPSRTRPTAVLLLGASAVIVGLVFFPQERFRIPVIDPVLVISAAAAITGSARPAPGELA
jgi:4-amino-4-deoxy-L-arabinose transferase-like glycosyltransferase